MNATLKLPDIANDSQPDKLRPLSWVGMSGIDLPCSLLLQDHETANILCRADAHVDIAQPDQRGIHMSRLYLDLQEQLQHQPISSESLQALLLSYLHQHTGISQTASLQLHFKLPLKRKALRSNFSGWKAYPAFIAASQQPSGFKLELGVKVFYSSTCPCSAALSRQLLEQRFREDFAHDPHIDANHISQWLLQNGSLATPHSQRSTAHIRVELASLPPAIPLIELVDQAEEALQTVVQTAVKRADEQAFAALNGHNQMFCEDAARRVAHTLDEQPLWKDFWVRIEHHESLHAHDATAVCVKGINGGYQPLLHR